MSEDERKRRIETIRRELRVAYLNQLGQKERAKRFEPDHRHPEKSLW